ncbi:hypothetical protein HK096_006093, partial [Nowakowskiella sp. JEL0078]
MPSGLESSVVCLNQLQSANAPLENPCDLLTPELINDLFHFSPPESYTASPLPGSEIITPLNLFPDPTFLNPNWSFETPLFEPSNTFDINQFFNNQISQDLLSPTLHPASEILNSDQGSTFESETFFSIDTPYSLASTLFPQLPTDFGNSYPNEYDLFPSLNDVISTSPLLFNDQFNSEIQQQNSPFDNNLLESLTQIVNSTESSQISLQIATLLASLSTLESGPEIIKTLRNVISSSEHTVSESSVAPTSPILTQKRRRTGTLYTCDHPECGRAFTRRSNLKAHKTIHDPNRERPFTCEICLKAFIRPHDLKRHQPVHSKVKEFDCEKCSKLFTRKDAKDRHLSQGKC